MLESIQFIAIKLCDECNFDCTYCFERKSLRTHSSIFHSEDKLKSLLLTLNLSPVVHVVFLGGEIGLYPERVIEVIKVLKKIERVRDTKFIFGIITNGTNFKYFLDYSKLINFEFTKISWDGITASSIARTVSEDTINQSIIDLGNSRYKDDVLVSLAITVDNIDYLVDSFKYALDKGCSKLSYYFIFNDEFDKIYLEDSFQRKFINQLNEIYDLYIDRQFSFENLNMLFYKLFVDKNFNYSHKCRFLGKMLCITPDDNIYPCLLIKETKLIDNDSFLIGNLNTGLDDDLVDKFSSIYKKVLSTNNEECNECSNRSTCSECPAETYYHLNNFKRCYVRKKFHSIENRIFKEHLSELMNSNIQYTIKRKMSYLQDENLIL